MSDRELYAKIMGACSECGDTSYDDVSDEDIKLTLQSYERDPQFYNSGDWKSVCSSCAEK